VYNEKIYDLISSKISKEELEIRESKNGDVQIPELITLEVTSLYHAFEILALGLHNRVTGSTMANA